MPRKSRKTFNSNYFHVIVQGIEKKYIFEEEKMKAKYVKKLIEKEKVANLKVMAYCIMDNHAHILIYVENIENLSKYMQCVNISFARYYNKTKNRVGYVFRNRFKSIPIINEKHLYNCLAYIHLNPVYAKMCAKPELYRFSSYNDYIKFKGFVNKETLDLLNYEKNSYLRNFKFLHYLYVDGEEYEEKIAKEDIIQQYIDENGIKDIIFQSEKVKKMIIDLKKKRISFSEIAKFLGVSIKRLKEMIFE